MKNYKLLENIFEQYTVLNNIKILLDWDSNVNLPSDALKIRAKQNAAELAVCFKLILMPAPHRLCRLSNEWCVVL